MAYEMYVNGMLLPVPPSKITEKIKGRNKTLTLINDIEINLVRSAGLTEISFDLLLPNTLYSFAVYDSGFKNAKFFLDEFERLKVQKKVFPLIITRTFPKGKMIFDTHIAVTLEDYSIIDDVKQGFDTTVSVKMKQAADYMTKVCDLDLLGVSFKNKRTEEDSPAPSTTTTYTVVKGDSLWKIAKMFYGNGSKYPAIYHANKDKISNPNLIYVGQVLTIPSVDELGNYPTTVPTTSVKKTMTTEEKSKAIQDILDDAPGYGVQEPAKTANGVVLKADKIYEYYTNLPPPKYATLFAGNTPSVALSKYIIKK